LHANAELEFRQHRQMVSLVVDDGWTITAAAVAPQTSPELLGSGSLDIASTEIAVCSTAARHRMVANRTDEQWSR
jgi:hypothetical protein